MHTITAKSFKLGKVNTFFLPNLKISRRVTLVYFPIKLGAAGKLKFKLGRHRTADLNKQKMDATDGY